MYWAVVSFEGTVQGNLRYLVHVEIQLSKHSLMG